MESQASRPPPRLLIVDDDPDMRDYVRNCLRPLAARLGRIRDAADGLEALQVLGRERAELVIAAVRMPRLDGVELAGVLSGRRIPVLLVDGDLTGEQTAGFGVFGLVSKPFDSRDLCDEVERLLRLTPGAGPDVTGPRRIPS